MRHTVIFSLLIFLYTAASAQTDVSIKVSSPIPDTVCAGYSLKVMVQVKNNGTDPVYNIPVLLYAKADSGTVIIKRDTVKSYIVPGGFYGFQWILTPVKMGRYQVSVVHHVADDIATNDSAAYTTYFKPAIKTKFAQKDVHVCKGDSAHLKIITDATNISWYAIDKPGRPAVNTGKEYNYVPLGTSTGSVKMWQFRIVALSTDKKLCDFVDTINVYVHSLPNVDLGPDRVLCAGDSAVLSDICTSCSHSWSTGETTPTITVRKGGRYRVYATDTITGCFRSDSVYIDIPAGPDLSAYEKGCEGEQIVFDSHYDADSFYWDLGIAKSALANPAATYSPGEYDIKLTAIKGTCTTKVSQRLHVYPKLSADFTVTGDCMSAPVIFSALDDSTHDAGAKYTWIFDDAYYNDTSSAIARDFHYATTYSCTLEVTNPSGCSIAVSKSFKIHPAPYVVFTADGDTLITGAGKNYEWYIDGDQIPGADTNKLVAKKSGYYMVSFENEFGCRGYSSKDYVKVLNSSVNNGYNDGQISVWPNPGHDKFFIRWMGERYDRLDVINIEGQVIMSNKIAPAETETVIDMTGMKAGVYILRASGSVGLTYTRLLKL